MAGNVLASADRAYDRDVPGQDSDGRPVVPVPDGAPRAGAQGERFETAVLAFLGVFALGFAVIAVVLLSRRRTRDPSSRR